MTFSIVAFDADSHSWGIAVASKFLAVGAVVPWGRAGAGAVATQAAANLAYGPGGIDLLASGSRPARWLSGSPAPTTRGSSRQCGVVDARGRGATFTGAECLDWAGGRPATVRGAGQRPGRTAGCRGDVRRVARAMRSAVRATVAGGLAAGDRAGGDRRGRQSAALRVWRAGAAYGGVLDSPSTSASTTTGQAGRRARSAARLCTSCTSASPTLRIPAAAGRRPGR